MSFPGTVTQREAILMISRDAALYALSTLLGSSVRNAAVQEPPFERINSFHAPEVCEVPVSTLVQQLGKYSPVSTGAIVAAYSLIGELRKDIRLSASTVHRLLVGSITVSTKFHDDGVFQEQGDARSYYGLLGWHAKIAGIPKQDLVAIELEILQRKQWRLGTSIDRFVKVQRQMMLSASMGAGAWKRRLRNPTRQLCGNGTSFLRRSASAIEIKRVLDSHCASDKADVS
jgi:hypothetical protein